MAKALRIEDVGGDEPKEIAILRAEKTPIGRDPGQGIRVESPAVSRVHGTFVPCRGHWLFLDEGSTNGSWVNGIKLDAGRLRLLRPGDHLQIADMLLRLSPLSEDAHAESPLSAEHLWSLIVFVRDEFRDEFPVPKVGKALIIGGKEADLRFPDEAEASQAEPTAVFERRKDSIHVFQVDKSRPVFINGAQLERTTPLSDNDWVDVGAYRVLFNCPPPVPTHVEKAAISGGASTPKEGSDTGQFDMHGKSGLKSWGEEPSADDASMQRRPAANASFGKSGTAEASGLTDAYGGARDSHATTTTVLTRAQVRREVYQPRAMMPEEEEESGLRFRLLIVVLSGVVLLLLILVLMLILRP